MPPVPLTSLVGRVCALMAGASLLLLGFIFSLVLAAVIVVAGLMAWGYFWWRTRELRRAMTMSVPHAGASGQVFDGEATVVEERSVAEERLIAGNPEEK